MSDLCGDIKIAIEGEDAKRMYDLIVNSYIGKEFPNTFRLDYRENLLFVEESWWGYSAFVDFVLPFLVGDNYYYLSYEERSDNPWTTNDTEGKYFTIPDDEDEDV